MPVTSIAKDAEALTMTVVADFAVSQKRLWDAYADPRQLERFWGPPDYPATFTRHDLFPGGQSVYFMTGPEGEKSYGLWEFTHVEEPHRFEVLDSFANPDGTANTDLPTMRLTFQFETTATGSRLTTVSYFNSADDLAKTIDMRIEEGLKQAMGQIDAVVEDLRTFAADLKTYAQILSDTQVRISRVINGPVDLVWRAHHDPELLRRWLLGPDGWTMPVCVVASNVGETYRYEWESVDGTNRFGFTGEVLESHAPNREVVTEAPIGIPGPVGRNELTLTQLDAGTLLSIVITYPDAETRDAVLATGMTDGMETSYARLEREVLAAV